MTTLRAITLKVGQRVRVTEKALAHVNESFRDKTGVIVQIYPLIIGYPISVLFDDLPGRRCFEESELEKVE